MASKTSCSTFSATRFVMSLWHCRFSVFVQRDRKRSHSLLDRVHVAHLQIVILVGCHPGTSSRRGILKSDMCRAVPMLRPKPLRASILGSVVVVGVSRQIAPLRGKDLRGLVPHFKLRNSTSVPYMLHTGTFPSVPYQFTTWDDILKLSIMLFAINIYRSNNLNCIYLEFRSKGHEKKAILLFGPLFQGFS